MPYLLRKETHCCGTPPTNESAHGSIWFCIECDRYYILEAFPKGTRWTQIPKEDALFMVEQENKDDSQKKR